MTLTELSKQIRFQNAKKGFDCHIQNVEQKLLLAVSEICEAQEELRNDNDPVKIYYENMDGLPYSARESLEEFPDGLKPEGFSVEIADAIIRLLDICGAFNIDIDNVIQLKLAYNQTRLHKHGRQF